MSMLIDIGAIKDEDLLRRMWQETDDFCRKKEIRAHMYKLRETRLRDFYSGDMDAGIGLSKTPLTASHGDSLADQSFQSFKTKEIRDSESPTREFKYGVPANLGGWNIMTSSELSNDGKMHTTHSLATTGGVHDLTDGQAKFTGRNEKISSVAFDGDDKNYTTSSGENTNTVLEENIVQGNENNRRIENKKSTVTTSSKVLRSHYESGDNGYEPEYVPCETIERKIIYNEAPQPRVVLQHTNNNGPRNSSPPSNNKSEQLISRTVEYPDPHTKVIREVKSLPDGSTITTTKYETRSANSEVWTSSNSSKNTSASTSRVIKEDRAEHNRIQYIIDDRGNQVPYQPNRHIQNKTTKDVEGYEIIIDTTNDRNVPINKTTKKDLTRDMERLTDQDDVVRTTTTTTTTTKTNRNNDDVYDVKRPTKVDKKPIETEYTRKRISVDLDPTHEAFARSLRCVSPVSDRDSIRSHRSATSSVRSSISPDKGFRSRRSNSRDTDISQISSQTVTKSGPTPGLKSPQRASPGKRPDNTTTTVKTEKIIRIPDDGKPNNQQSPRQPSQLVTDLDSDDTTETKITTVTTTTTATENKDKPKSNRPPFVRSETYEERCRKILGMPEPDDQPKSPATRRSKFTTTTTDFIENEKVDIVKNRTVPTERPNSKSPEKSTFRKPSGRSTMDEPTINTNTFDRKTPRRPENSSPERKLAPGRGGGAPSDDIIETTVNRTSQRRPSEKVPDSKSPSRVSPDRKSPSKIIETNTITETRQSPRGPTTEGLDHRSPDRKTPNRSTVNRESPDRKPSKIVETTKTTIIRATPRRPGDDRVSPDRKSPSRRPTTDQSSPDRRTVITKNVKNVDKYDVEIHETIIDRKQRKTPQPINKFGSPDSDAELIDESEPEFETIDRKPTRPTECISDDEPSYHPTTTDTTEDISKISTVDRRKHHGPLDNEPEYLDETDEDTPIKPGSETDEEITEMVVTETVLDRKKSRRPLDESPDRCRPEHSFPTRPSKLTKEEIETTTSYKTPRRPSDGSRRPTNSDSPNRPTKETKETTGSRKIPRRLDDDAPDFESPLITTETDEEFVETTVTRKTQRLPTDSLTKPPNSRKTPNAGETPDHPARDRPTKFTTNVTETDEGTTESTVTRKAHRRPKDESPDRQSPNRKTTERPTTDRRSPGRPSTVMEEITETTITRKTPHRPNDVSSKRKIPDRQIRRPKDESPDHQSPDRQSPDRIFKTSKGVIETDEDTIESIVNRKIQRRPNDESPDRQLPAIDRKSPNRPSRVTEELTESKITRKTSRHPDDLPTTRNSTDRPFKITTNVTETDDEIVESSVTRDTMQREKSELPDRESPNRTVQVDRRSPDRKTTTEITETSVSRKGPRHPEDVTPNRQSPDRPSTVTTNVIGTNEEYVDTTTVIRKTPDRRSPGRIVQDRQSPDRPSKVTGKISITTDQKIPNRRSPDRSATETDEEYIESTVTRETKRHEKDESPDRQSPSRTVVNRRSPDRTTTTEITSGSIVSHKTPRNIEDCPPDRKSPHHRSPDRPSTNVTGTNEELASTTTPVTRKVPDRQSPERTIPDRRSPDRPSKVTEEIIETTVIRNMPNRRSPDRSSNVTETDEEVVETIIARRNLRRPTDDTLPDRRSPNRQSPTHTVLDRRSPDSKTGTQITEMTISRKTPRQSKDSTPVPKSPDRRSPDRPSTFTSNIKGTNAEYIKTTVTHKIPDRQSPGPTVPDRRSPDRPSKVTEEITETTVNQKIPNRQSPDRPSNSTNIIETDDEVSETIVTRKIQPRPNNDTPVCTVPDRRSPDRKTLKQTTRSPERPSKVTRNFAETDRKIIETTHIRKAHRQPNESPVRRSPGHTIPDRRSPGRKISKDVIETITTKKSSRYPENASPDRKTPDRRSPDRSSKINTEREIVETRVTRKIPRRPNDDSPDRVSPGRNDPDRRSPNRKSPTKVTETKTTRKIPRHSEQSPDRPYKTDTNRTDTDEEIVETTVTRKTLYRPIDGSPERRSPDRRSPDRRSPDHKLVDRSNRSLKVTNGVTETSVTSKIERYPTTRSPDRKTTTDKPRTTTADNTSPVRSSKINKKKNDEEFTETIVTRKTIRRLIDGSPDRKTPSRLTINTTRTSSSKPDTMSPDRTHRRPMESPTRKTTTTVTKTTTGRRPTSSYPDDTSPLRRKPVQKLPEEIVESDEPIDEPSNRRRVDTSSEPGYRRPTQSSRPKAQSPDRKISTSTYVNETDEEIHETILKLKPSYAPVCEPVNRRLGSKIPDLRSPDRKTSTTTITHRPVSNDKSPTRRTSRPRSPNQEDSRPVHRTTATKTIISRQPDKDRPVDRSPERRTSEESEIDDETVEVNQYEKFIQNEINDTETNRQPKSERPGPLRRKPDDVEVIFERAVDTTNQTEVDNILVEEERAVGCKLTGEPDEPRRRPQESSPTRRQPSEYSPSRQTTLKKSSKFDDDTEEITTSVERRTIRRPNAPEISPDRQTSRLTKSRSPETSPVRRNIIKTVKEIIISPTPQTTFSQPGPRKTNLDRINSEIITDRDEKRTTTTTTIKSRQKTAPEIVPSIVQRYTSKTESPVTRANKKKPVEFTPGPNEIVEEVFVKKEAKKLCDGDVCGPRSLTNGTSPTKRIGSKQDASVRPAATKITEKIDRFTSNATTTQGIKRSSVTERKNTAPIIPSSRVPATDKFGRSASENQIRAPHAPKIEVDEPVNKERRPSLKSKTARPTKCIATKTINITNTKLTVDNDEMDVVIDIQQAKSSREPSPNKIVPVPVSPETDTGPSRYPDNVTEPEDERKPRRKVTNIPIFEEETSTFVSCDITEIHGDNVPHYDDLEEGNVDESDDDVDHDRIVKVTDNDECLLSVSDKVSRFINLADDTVTSKVTTKKTEVDREIIDRRRPVTKDLENDDCLLSVSDKVSKFIMTAEEFKKPKASADFVTIEKTNETENRRRPEPETTEDEEIDYEDEEVVHATKSNRVNARKVTKVVEKKPSETVITTTTTTTTRKVKPVETRPADEEITVTHPKETKISTIASKFTKPIDQLSRQSSIKRITTDTKVSSIRTKFDKNVEPDDETDEPIDEAEDHGEPGTRGREPFFLNQISTNTNQIEKISKIVQSSYVDSVPDNRQPSKGSVTDRFKPNTEGSKIKKITPTPILQSTQVMKKAKEIFENKPNERPKQIDILSRPSVWKYKTNNDVKLTDIGVHTTKTSTREEIETSEDEGLVEPQTGAPKTPKLSARDEFTLKNLRDVTNISSKKDLFERKFSSDRITTTNTTSHREFSESPVGGSPTDSQGRYPSSNKPSYMNHTVSSLEHINRRDSRSQITSDHESIDDNNSINSTKFGVELRRVDSQNATKTRRKSSSTEIPCIEEIWDSELLERMLETVVGYEHRRRIRSQIRIIKKQIEDEEMHMSHRTSSEIKTKHISKERTRSPTSKRIETITTTTTVPKSQPTRKLSPMRTVTKISRVIDEPDQKVSKVVTTTTSISKGGDITDDDKPIWMKKNLLKKPSENQIKTPTPPTAVSSSSSTTRKYNTSSYREVEKTDSVTSSYGIGPTDENGKPLFGIRALKKQAQKTEQPNEPVYSTDSDTYQTDDQRRRIVETVNLRAPQKIREGFETATTTVKKSTKNFIQHEIAADEPESGAEEIEKYEYESNDRHAQTKFTKTVRSNVQSFLGSEKASYTGFNDVIDRMKNADLVQVDGDTESDREARALLNKFLGASILVQATENAVAPDGIKVTQKKMRTLKSDSPAASSTSATRQVTTTKLTKVKSSNNNNKDSSGSNNNTGAVATTITTTAVNDIDSIWDESYLRKLLEQTTSYEERRKIRARIRQIMADKEACTDLVEQTTKDLSASSINTILTTSSSQSSEMDNTNDNSNVTDNDDNNKKSIDGNKSDAKTEDIDGGKTTTEIVKETKKDDDGGVTTTTTKVTRTVTASKPVSPFAKFRQLDKQASTQSPPNSPHNPNTPKTPGQTSAPIFKFTDPALNRRVATFKEQLLQWCQIKTREYENVKIENFSTSWSDGLAFCALIHHFRPDAFDYTKLVGTQRRYNFDLAFRVADEKAGIAPLLDVEDMVVMRKPDWKCVFTYVQSIHRRFKDAD